MDIDNIQNSRSSVNTVENMEPPNMKLFESMTGSPIDGIDNQNNSDQGLVMESYENQGGNMEPQGFNDDTSCVTGCGGSGSRGNKDNRRELNAMCGNVKTWTNQESAQGLDGEVVGLQSSIGYPL
jgi:hypothetical protein